MYLRVDEGRNAELVERERIMFRLGAEVGRRTQAEVPAPVSTTAPVSSTPAAGDTPTRDIDLEDRADRVRYLLDFVAGYAMLVDVCEDAATVDQLKMGYLGIPLLEAAEVVKELSAAWYAAESGGAA